MHWHIAIGIDRSNSTLISPARRQPQSRSRSQLSIGSTRSRPWPCLSTGKRRARDKKGDNSPSLAVRPAERRGVAHLGVKLL
ncbi:hypothetical protein DPMN_123992 [Dreissena polymorpha]|uniref:Uncharacterized protein n=1 Tax=Dreissena polymorpha TaxID=45954 RepID=A0A9D4GSP0_DREPO|nr:hypothetical protein DPMN_123992 [Dreissena polymorpha]